MLYLQYRLVFWAIGIVLAVIKLAVRLEFMRRNFQLKKSKYFLIITSFYVKKKFYFALFVQHCIFGNVLSALFKIDSLLFYINFACHLYQRLRSTKSINFMVLWIHQFGYHLLYKLILCVICKFFNSDYRKYSSEIHNPIFINRRFPSLWSVKKSWNNFDFFFVSCVVTKLSKMLKKSNWFDHHTFFWRWNWFEFRNFIITCPHSLLFGRRERNKKFYSTVALYKN